MIITYQGASFFKVQFGDTVVAYNPISKESRLKSTRFGADITLVSLHHPDFNGVETVDGKDSYVINGPGEYEVKGVFIRSFPSVSNYDGVDWINTIYTVNLENMNLCFLGAVATKDLSPDVREALDDIDILFVPIGGDGVLTPAEAYRLAVSIEPKIIVPMHYGDIGQKDALKLFLKEGGVNPDPVDKLTIKKKDLEGKEGEIVVISV